MRNGSKIKKELRVRMEMIIITFIMALVALDNDGGKYNVSIIRKIL